MKSKVELEINARQPDLAALFADPRNNPRWMDDIDRFEPIRGELGKPGSVYRLVPKRGSTAFVATVVMRDLPTKLKLSLDAPGVSVQVTDTLLRLSDHRTKLISEEEFTFKGAFRKITGLLAIRAIKRVHRRHMESFKHFAEGQTP